MVAQGGMTRFGSRACVSSAAMRLDSVQIGVADLATGTADYARLVGRQPETHIPPIGLWLWRKARELADLGLDRTGVLSEGHATPASLG